MSPVPLRPAPADVPAPLEANADAPRLETSVALSRTEASAPNEPEIASPLATPEPEVAAAEAPRQTGEEAAVRTLIARWYEELAKRDQGRVLGLTAPGFIEASPHYRHLDTGAANLGPRVFTSLAARALKFDYDIDRVRIDPNFAKVDIWERGYFFAWAAQKTYESAADTVFVLERQGLRWRLVDIRLPEDLSTYLR